VSTPAIPPPPGVPIVGCQRCASRERADAQLCRDFGEARAELLSLRRMLASRDAEIARLHNESMQTVKRCETLAIRPPSLFARAISWLGLARAA
jgi:hypothetical protein